VAVTREHLLRLLGAASDPLRNRVMFWLIIASFSFVALSIIIMMIGVGLVRWSFWKNAALAGPHKWRTYLLQLPLGAPEGSIRALLSLFVVGVGFLVIAMQGYLGLGNTEAIAGFVGSVITFYFTSRNSEQARKVIAQAHAAADTTATNTADVIQKATDSATTAQRETSERIETVAQTAIDNSRQTTAMALRAVTDTAAGTAGETVASVDAGGMKSRLESVRDRLNSIQQIARGVSSLGVSGETLPAAVSTIATAADLLGKIGPLLSGKPDAGSVENVLRDAEAKLPALEAAGLPGAMAESIEVLRNVASPILAGIPGGPIGIAGGVLLAGIRLADRQRDLNAFKAAVLSKPFDPGSAAGHTRRSRRRVRFPQSG
jgi:ABC-type Co2+ transport system permease subunit